MAAKKTMRSIGHSSLEEAKKITQEATDSSGTTLLLCGLHLVRHRLEAPSGNKKPHCSNILFCILFPSLSTEVTYSLTSNGHRNVGSKLLRDNDFWLWKVRVWKNRQSKLPWGSTSGVQWTLGCRWVPRCTNTNSSPPVWAQVGSWWICSKNLNETVIRNTFAVLHGKLKIDNLQYILIQLNYYILR